MDIYNAFFDFMDNKVNYITSKLPENMRSLLLLLYNNYLDRLNTSVNFE